MESCDWPGAAVNLRWARAVKCERPRVPPGGSAVKRNTAIYRSARILPLLALLACLTTPAALAQSRITGLANCPPAGATGLHFDVTPLQADYKVMVSEFEVEPDISIRLVNRFAQADLVFADGEPDSEVTVCRSPTRYRATTLFVAKFVTQPDITIMMNSRVEHPDYTLYVDSESYSPDEAAAVFAVLWDRQRRNPSEAH